MCYRLRGNEVGYGLSLVGLRIIAVIFIMRFFSYHEGPKNNIDVYL